MKTIVRFVMSLVLCFVAGHAMATCLGADPVAGGTVAILVSAAAGHFLPSGCALDGVLVELWTGELVKAFKAALDGSWLDGIPDASSKVDNDVIHLVDVGADPDVLVNNTTYPIDSAQREDEDIPISLDKFDTENTAVTDDELHAISYDKISSVIESHADALNAAKFSKAAFNMCASGDTATTPVFATTGDADAVGRKKCTVNDILEMKRKMDALKVPSVGRRLVLCPAHAADLLETSQAFAEQYKGIDRNTGRVGQIFGFEVFEFNGNPTYTDLVKETIGTPEDAEDGTFMASFAFYVKRAFKASGSRKMYYHDSTDDPQNRQNLIGFREWFVCLPKKADSGVVLCSGVAEAEAEGGAG